MTWWLDVVLAIGATMRLTRLVVTDDWGQWYIVNPIMRLVARVARRMNRNSDHARVWWHTGLGCPFCVGYWIGCGVLLSLWLAGGPGETWEPWRWGAATLALNYVAAHIGSRLD